MSIERAHRKKVQRGYKFLCWAIDLHGTIAVPSYDLDEKRVTLYQGAKEALRYLSDSDAHKLILWTSTHPVKYDAVIAQLSNMDIHFDYINENPEFDSTELTSFTEKFAFDILLDDKAGFIPECFDWNSVYNNAKAFDQANIVMGDSLVRMETIMMDSLVKYTLLGAVEKEAFISDGKLGMNGKVTEGSAEELRDAISKWFSGEVGDAI